MLQEAEEFVPIKEARRHDFCPAIFYFDRFLPFLLEITSLLSPPSTDALPIPLIAEENDPLFLILLILFLLRRLFFLLSASLE